MAELMFGLSQTKKKKTEEAKVRSTKNSLKDVTITDTVEKEVRKEQHQREQTWKKTGRDQIKQNTNFDMARSLFGGGGPAPATVDTEEDDEVEETTEQLGATHLEDQEHEDQGTEEDDGEEYEGEEEDYEEQEDDEDED